MAVVVPGWLGWIVKVIIDDCRSDKTGVCIEASNVDCDLAVVGSVETSMPIMELQRDSETTR